MNKAHCEGVFLENDDRVLVGSSLVFACRHALIWMFLFYCVCLFVCVCILCSVVYQDGFYGADIYVSIAAGMTLHVTLSLVSDLMLNTCKSQTLDTCTWLHTQLGEQIAVQIIKLNDTNIKGEQNKPHSNGRQIKQFITGVGTDVVLQLEPQKIINLQIWKN